MDEDRAAQVVDLDDVADGTHTAAAAAIHTSIRHIDRSAIVTTQEEELDAELQVNDNMAEHMASLQVKRLKSHIDKVSRRAAHLERRVKEADAEQKKHKADLESGRLRTQEAMAHATDRIKQLENERVHWVHTEKRLQRDLELTRKDVKQINTALRANKDLEQELVLMLAERDKRVGESVGDLDTELDQLAEKKAEGQSRLQYAQLDAAEEEELRRELAQLEVREDSVQQEKDILVGDKTLIEKEVADITAAMQRAQQREEEEADVVAAEAEVAEAQQSGDPARLVAAQQRLALEQAELARVRASLAGEQTLLVAIEDKDQKLASIANELEVSRNEAAALREQLQSATSRDGRPLSREEQVQVGLELQDNERRQTELTAHQQEASNSKDSMVKELEVVKQITAEVVNATPTYLSNQSVGHAAHSSVVVQANNDTVRHSEPAPSVAMSCDFEEKQAMQKEIERLRSRVIELEAEMTQLMQTFAEDGSNRTQEEAVHILTAQNQRLSEELEAARKHLDVILQGNQVEKAAKTQSVQIQNQCVEDARAQNDSVQLTEAREEIIRLQQLLLAQEEIADAASTAASNTRPITMQVQQPLGTAKGDAVTETEAKPVAASGKAVHPANAGSATRVANDYTGDHVELAAARVEIEALTNELRTVQTRLDDCEKALVKKKMQYDKLEAKAAANDELLAAQAELERSEKKVRRYKDLLSTSEQDSLLAQERLLRSMRELQLTTQKLDDAHDQVRKSQAETAGYRIKLGELQQEHKITEGKLADALTELETLRGLKGMQQRCLELETEVKRLQGLLSSQQAEISRLSQELDDVKRKLASALSELCRPVAEVVEMGVQSEESANEVADSLLSDILTSAVQLGMVNAQWQARLDSEIEMRLAAEAERDDIAERARAALEEVEKAQKQAQKFREQLGTALGQVEQLTKRVGALESELASVEEERNGLRAQLEEVTAQIANLEGQLETEIAKTKSLVQELNMLKMTQEGLKKKLEAAMAEIEVLTTTIEEMRAELRRNGIVDKWKQAALAAQLERARGMIPVRPESRENDSQTDPPPPPKPASAVAAVLPELAVSVQAGATVERTVRIVNYGEGALRLSSGTFSVVDDSAAPSTKPAWINWADPTFNGELELAGVPSIITADIKEDTGDASRPDINTCILPEAPVGSISITLQSAEVGTHEAQMVFSTNDPRQPVVAVPITFTVLPLPPVRPSSRDGGMQTDAVPEPEPVIVTKEIAVENTDEIDRLRAELAALRQAYANLQREVENLRAENSALKDTLSARDAELARLREQMSELEAALKRAAEAGGDNDFYERMEWERNIREQLKGMVVDTCDHGVQTDSDEHKIEALEQRNIAHGSAAGRELHKPRFLAPLVDDATLAARPLKSLRWLLKVIESVYEAKFLADAVDNRYGHPHDPLPEFIYMWTVKRYGLRDLVGATRWDIANAVDYYGHEHCEVRIFGAFMNEEYGTEQLGFFLYCRS